MLARAWRPGTPYHGWRFAALVVLATTGVTWFFWPDAAGYVGGGAWFFLLFLPAIGLRKMTQLATQGDYKSAANLGAALQILHPSGELREGIRFFRRLGSNTALRRNFSFVPTDYPRAGSARRDQLRNTPAVFILIVMKVLAFLFEMSAGGMSEVCRMGPGAPYTVVVQREYWRLLTALFLHGGFFHLGFNLFALYVLGPPLERAIGTMRFAACYLISGLASSAVALT